MKNVRVENMTSDKGNKIPNQFKVFTENGVYFQSYDSIIAFKPYSGKIQLDEYYWNYSRTTRKYRNLFLHESTKETERKIEEGIYELINLN